MDTHCFRWHTRRTAYPFLIFAVTLFGILSVAWIALPLLFRVDIGGEIRDVDDVRSYHREVKNRLRDLEEHREAFVVSYQDPLYRALKQKKDTQHSFYSVRSDLEHIAKNIIPEQPDAITLDSIHYDRPGNAVHITGVVRNVGPRSMTVLAQLVDAMAGRSFVNSVEHPTFVRNEDPVIGFYSPFTITLFLQ